MSGKIEHSSVWAIKANVNTSVSSFLVAELFLEDALKGIKDSHDGDIIILEAKNLGFHTVIT